MLEDAQHVEEKLGPSQIHYKQDGRKNRADRRDPKRDVDEVKHLQNKSGRGKKRRHSGRAADEEVDWNFPRPDWRPNDGLTVIAGTFWNRSAGDIDAAARDGAALFCLRPQGVETCF